MKETAEKKTLAGRVKQLEQSWNAVGCDFHLRLNKMEDVAECFKVGHAHKSVVRAFLDPLSPGRLDIDYLVTVVRRCTRCDAWKEDRFDLRSRKDRKAFLAFLRA